MEPIRLFASRANIYRILADCFKYPDPSLADILELIPAQKGWGLSAELENELDRLPGLFHVDSSGFQEIELEYTRLFVGPYHVPASPYSSVYLDPEPMVMGISTLEAIDFYERAGLNPDENEHVLPDHISTELEFMYYLLFQYVSQNNPDFMAMAESFFSRHLGQWGPTFAELVLKNARHPYYQKLGQVLALFFAECTGRPPLN
ncbi:MAG: molecular chaperone [SAR324 cluster bacterium]|nr:molecular chaperone [SAR324 cluster bacterium]